MRNTWLGKKSPFEWRLRVCLLIALAITGAVLPGSLTDFEQRESGTLLVLFQKD